MADGVSDVMRFAVNHLRSRQKHRQDFGATLSVWRVKSGPYVVLPLLGSPTMRDSIALPVNFAGNP